MTSAAPGPTWRVVEVPFADSLDHPDAGVYRELADLERTVALHDLGHDDFPPRAVDLVVATAHQEHVRRVRFLAFADDDAADAADGAAEGGGAGRVVGHGVLSLPVVDNRHLAVARVAVLPTHRGRGIGSALAERLRRVALTEGRRTLFAEVEFAAEPPAGAPDVLTPREGDGRVSAGQPGMGFARRAGLVLEIVARRSVLDLPLPDGALDRFVADATAHADGYRVHTWHGRVPGRWVDEFAALEQQLDVDEPHGGLDMEPQQWDADRVRAEEVKAAERGQESLVTVAEHVASGTLAGMTELLWSRSKPELTEQESTVVLPAHRGHRLGMLVKAVNLREHARLRPEARRISTWNNEVNGPMLAINVALGFRPAGGAAELQAPLAEVRAQRPG